MLLLFFLVPNMIWAQDNWIIYESKSDLSFTVEVPGEMEKTENTVKTAVGDLAIVNYAYQGSEEDPNYLYLINIVQYPEETFPKDSVGLMNEYLASVVESSVAKVNGELIYSSDIDRGTGKLFRIKFNNGDAIIKGKSFIRDDVFISLQVFTIQNKSLNDEMDVFLESFKLKS